LIVVKALGVARSFMDDSQRVDLREGSTVEDVLKALPLALQELAAKRELGILINGADISTKEETLTRLHDGDVVVLLPFAHGGRGP
jgi:molybdopterin converting factor small subunit